MKRLAKVVPSVAVSLIRNRFAGGSKVADIVVLERNLFDIPRKEICKVKLQLTLLAAREVYRTPTFPALAQLTEGY